jgi:2-dehydro-3-deoxyphosphogluconate aldolase/(4S)-4-hydroxy-2-oxoglutarate aldolase
MDKKDVLDRIASMGLIAVVHAPSPESTLELVQALIKDGVWGIEITYTTRNASCQAGSDVVKLFPGSLGGPDYLKALHGPFPDIPLIPTGGVDIDNMADWFQAGAFAVGAGSSLCPKAWVAESRCEQITARAKNFFQAVEGARAN